MEMKTKKVGVSLRKMVRQPSSEWGRVGLRFTVTWELFYKTKKCSCGGFRGRLALALIKNQNVLCTAGPSLCHTPVRLQLMHPGWSQLLGPFQL